MMYVILGNYGNNTLALMQWVYQNNLQNVFVVHIDTGWADKRWPAHVARGQEFAKKCEFTPVTLKSAISFSDLVKERRQFPSKKFQWCVSLLKACTLLNWLDKEDSNAKAIILMGSRRMDSRVRINLSEYIEQSEHFDGRKVWYPLFNHCDQQRNHLIEVAGFTVLPHRSLECNPCVHDFQQLNQRSKQRCAHLEKQINKTMFVDPEQQIEMGIHEIGFNKKLISQSLKLELFDMGCGAFYACGE